MAVATPTGMMKAAHTPISQIVPQKAALMPAWSALIEVKLVRKSQVRLPAPSATMSTSRTPSSAIETPTQKSSAKRNAGPLPCSRRRGGPCRSHRRAFAHSYICLYLRTKRIEIMFMISVMTNSVVPTAKIVL